MSAARTLVHFLKWAIPVLPIYVAAGIAAGALGFVAFENASTTYPDPAYGVGVGYTPGDGASFGMFLGITSGLPVFLGLLLVNCVVAWLFRRRAAETWARWVFWGFGLAVGLMPVLAFLSSGLTFVSTRSDADLAALDPDRQARALALAQAGQTATVVLTLTLFSLAVFVSWWNLRAGQAWMRKTVTEVESAKSNVKSA
jgi:hypothetical protein